MIDEWTFSLPGNALKVRPYLKIANAVPNREFLVLYDFYTENPLTETPSGLNWSDSFKHAFHYVPAASAGVVALPFFETPAEATQVGLKPIHRTTRGPAERLIETIVLETQIEGIPSVILHEETNA